MSDIGGVQANPARGIVPAGIRRRPEDRKGGDHVGQRILNYIRREGFDRESVKTVAAKVTQHLFGENATREEHAHVLKRVVNFLSSHGMGPGSGGGPDRRGLDLVV